MSVDEGSRQRLKVEIVKDDTGAYVFDCPDDWPFVSRLEDLGRAGSDASAIRALLEEYQERAPQAIDDLLARDDEDIEGLPGTFADCDIRPPCVDQFEQDAYSLDLPGVNYVTVASMTSGADYLEVEGRENLERLIHALSDKYDIVFREPESQ